MTASEAFENFAVTTVTSGATDAPSEGTVETWTVTSSASFPAASTGVTQFHICDPAASSEIILVTNVSGTTWTVTRGAESTTPVTHSAGFTVIQDVTAGFLNSLVTAVAAALANPMTTLGDLIDGGSSGAATRLAGNTTSTKEFLTSTGSGGSATAPAWGTITAGDMPAGTTSAKGALQLDGTAGDIQAVGSSAAAGSSGEAADAKHVHAGVQLAGDLGNTIASPQVVSTHLSSALPVAQGGTGAATAAQNAVFAGPSSGGSGAPSFRAVTTADVPTLNQNTTGTAANITDTLDQVPPPAANVAMASHKLTGLANGSASTDSAAFGQIPVADTTASDIQKVSTAAVAGSNGKWADSGHVHAGFFGGIFGTGADGPVTFDGTTTILGMVPGASTYTMTRDIQCQNITINNGVTVKTANFRIFFQGTLTNSGTISNTGAAGSGSSGGGTGGSGSFTGGRSGGGGGTGASGAGSPGTAAALGAAGGAGGAGVSGGLGAGGTTTNTATVAQNNLLQTPYAAATGATAYAAAAVILGFGAGGGGGGSDSSSNAGGGGGAGGGIIALFGWAINNGSGTITVAGGAGAAAAAGNAGGGGGGAGGLVVAYTLSAWTAGTITTGGGALGAGHGSGSNGSAGGSGLSLNVVLA